MSVTWTMRLYNRAGTPVTGTAYDGSTSNVIENATNRQMSFALNGIDTASFTVYLDDPMALVIDKFLTVKIWREVSDTENSKTLSLTSTRPDFAGVISGVNRNGESNVMQVNCQSPLWRLQSRFHILNHYLVTDPDTDDPYRQGGMLFKLIDLVNEAFGADSETGIVLGTISDQGPIVAPKFIGKGTNTWSNFKEMLDKPGSVDLTCQYWHTDGQQRMMDFNTDTKRGTDRSTSGVFWQYHTGLKNLANLEQDSQVAPNEFGNYLWVVGQGGPNSGLVAQQELTTGPYEMSVIGNYMKYIDREDVKTLGTGDTDSGGVKPIAASEIIRSGFPRDRYTASVTPGTPPYYGIDYFLGDVIRLDASKGALVVANAKQRIYEISLANSDNNMEQATVQLTDDFWGKVEGT